MATRGQSVARILRDWVLDGTYGSGDHLNENDISNALGVSRTPVRSALAMLAAEGLLEYTPNSGYVVRRYSVRDIEGVYAVRSVLEGLAARTVAEVGLPDQARASLHRNLADTKALCDAAVWSVEVQERWSRLNEAFHEAIFDATDNRHLRDVIAKSRSIPQLRAVKFRWHDLSTLGESYTDHFEIFDAVVGRQGARAEHLAREHVYRAGRRLTAHWVRVEDPPAAHAARRVSRVA